MEVDGRSPFFGGNQTGTVPAHAHSRAHALVGAAAVTAVAIEAEEKVGRDFNMTATTSTLSQCVGPALRFASFRSSGDLEDFPGFGARKHRVKG